MWIAVRVTGPTALWNSFGKAAGRALATRVHATSCIRLYMRFLTRAAWAGTGRAAWDQSAVLMVTFLLAKHTSSQLTSFTSIGACDLNAPGTSACNLVPLQAPLPLSPGQAATITFSNVSSKFLGVIYNGFVSQVQAFNPTVATVKVN